MCFCGYRVSSGRLRVLVSSIEKCFLMSTEQYLPKVLRISGQDQHIVLNRAHYFGINTYILLENNENYQDRQSFSPAISCQRQNTFFHVNCPLSRSMRMDVKHRFNLPEIFFATYLVDATTVLLANAVLKVKEDVIGMYKVF